MLLTRFSTSQQHLTILETQPAYKQPLQECIANANMPNSDLPTTLPATGDSTEEDVMPMRLDHQEAIIRPSRLLSYLRTGQGGGEVVDQTTLTPTLSAKQKLVSSPATRQTSGVSPSMSKLVTGADPGEAAQYAPRGPPGTLTYRVPRGQKGGTRGVEGATYVVADPTDATRWHQRQIKYCSAIMTII